MNEASWHLSTKYTYEIVGKREPAKVAMRMKIGEMATEILDIVRDDLLRAGVTTYLESIGYSQVEAALILRGRDETS